MTHRILIWRRLGLAMALLLVVVLIMGLTLHLYGRARLDAALAEYEDNMGAAPIVDFSQFERPLPSEHANAAVWLQAGADALIWSRAEQQLIKEVAHLPRAQWTAKHEEQIRLLVERNRGGLDILHRSADLEDANYGILYRHGAGLEIPELIPQLEAAFLLNVEARSAFASGDSASGLLAARALARLTTALDGEQVYIASLVAIVCEKMLVGVMLDTVRTGESWAAEPALLDDLAAILPTRDPIARAKELVALDVSALSTAARFGYRSAGDGPTRPSWIRRYLFGQWAAAELLTAAHQLAAMTKEPYPSGREQISQLPAPKLVNHWGDFDLDRGYFKSIFNGGSKHQKIAAQRQLARTALDLRRIGLEQGAYPSNPPPLAGLEEPDPFTGRKLVYQRHADGSATLALDGSIELAREIMAAHRHPLESFHAVDLPALPSAI